MTTMIVPANDNVSPLRPRDWYVAPAILVIPDEPPKIVAVAFYLGQSHWWQTCLPPHHAALVARRKRGRRFAKLG
jgi:hypothetical protein